MAGLPLPLRKPARKPPRLRLTAPVTREFPLHRQIADALTLELAPAGKVSADGVCWWSVDLASYYGPIPTTHIARGCVPGIWDLFVLHRGQSHVLEVKAEDGELSPWQQRLGAAMIGAGGKLAVIRDAREALLTLDAWGIPRRRRTTL